MADGICFISIFEVFFWQMLHIREYSLQKNIYDGVYFRKLKNLIAQMQFCYLWTSLQMEHVPKTSCLEKHILTKMSMVYHGFNNRVAILPKRELTLDLAEKPP